MNNVKNEVTQLKAIVENILEFDLLSRESDAVLYAKVIEFYGGYTLQDIKDLKISPASVIRIRQKLQQDGKYPPSKEVQEFRNKRKSQWHVEMKEAK